MEKKEARIVIQFLMLHGKTHTQIIFQSSFKQDDRCVRHYTYFQLSMTCPSCSGPKIMAKPLYTKNFHIPWSYLGTECRLGQPSTLATVQPSMLATATLKVITLVIRIPSCTEGEMVLGKHHEEDSSNSNYFHIIGWLQWTNRISWWSPSWREQVASSAAWFTADQEVRG